MRYFVLLITSFSVLLILNGCLQRKPITGHKNKGGVSIRIKKLNLPTGIKILTVNMSESGSYPIVITANDFSEATTDIKIPSLTSGKWQCRVSIKDNYGHLLFAGIKNINIVENTTAKIYLTVFPEEGKTGAIYFFVTYGNDIMEESTSTKSTVDSSGLFTDYSKNPILTRDGHPTNPFGLRGSKVIFDNGIFKMWYYSIYIHGIASIWYAESPDGLSWKTIGSTPVLSRGEPGTWDDFTVSVSAVIKENNTYKMYYLGYHKGNNLVGIHVNDVWHTGLAISTDGIHWTKNVNPVIYGTGFENMNISDIVKKDNIYYAYFTFSLSKSTDNNTRIGVATSSDGINWELHNIMSPTLKWEGNSVSSPTVLIEDGVFKMIYAQSECNSFGYATSTDGFNFNKKETPVFTLTNSLPNTCFIVSPYFRKINNKYWLYYTNQSTSGEMYICVATDIKKNL